MKKEEALALSEKAIEELAESLAAGKSKQLQRYLDVMSSFHQYSFCNCMLIVNQRPSATLVAGYAAWKKHGRNVKKGEKGICILAPLLGKKEDNDEEEQTIRGFRATHVFDVAQTEGEELPSFAAVSGDPGQKLTLLKEAIVQSGITVRHEASLGGASGVSYGGDICIANGLSEAEEFVTLAHEYAHELLHHGPDRLNFSKVVRELEAEAVAYIVAKAVGLENALSQSSDYIQLYSGNKDQLLQSLERIRKTAARIITGISSNTCENKQVLV